MKVLLLDLIAVQNEILQFWAFGQQRSQSFDHLLRQPGIPEIDGVQLFERGPSLLEDAHDADVDFETSSEDLDARLGAVRRLKLDLGFREGCYKVCNFLTQFPVSSGI